MVPVVCLLACFACNGASGGTWGRTRRTGRRCPCPHWHLARCGGSSLRCCLTGRAPGSLKYNLAAPRALCWGRPGPGFLRVRGKRGGRGGRLQGRPRVHGGPERLRVGRAAGRVVRAPPTARLPHPGTPPSPGGASPHLHGPHRRVPARGAHSSRRAPGQVQRRLDGAPGTCVAAHVGHSPVGHSPELRASAGPFGF